MDGVVRTSRLSRSCQIDGPLVTRTTEPNHLRFRGVGSSRVSFISLWRRRMKKELSFSQLSARVLGTDPTNHFQKRICPVKHFCLPTDETHYTSVVVSLSSFYFLVRFYKVCFLVPFRCLWFRITFPPYIKCLSLNFYWEFFYESLQFSCYVHISFLKLFLYLL